MQLPLIEPWFVDDETERWLGGSDWPRLMLDLADRPLGEFRGAVETGRFRWLAWQGESAVGYIDCGTFDRWTTWEGGPRGRGLVSAIEVPAGAFAYVIDPAQRRRGYGTAMIQELTVQPEVADVQLFAAGVELENVASVRTLARAGFHALDVEPDSEGIVYFARWRGRLESEEPGPPPHSIDS